MPSRLRPRSRDEDAEPARRRAACRNRPTAINDQVLQAACRRPPRATSQELLPHLQTRGEEYAADASKKLRERGEAEAKAMREILETQKKHIADTVPSTTSEIAPAVARLRRSRTNCASLNANRRYWDKRLAALEQELQTEPDRIRELYDVKANRIEPVGLVYLWPVTG